MNRHSHIATLVVVVGWMLFGCKPTTPSQYIQPDEIEDILVDYHMAKAMAQVEGNYDDLDYRQSLYFEGVLQKHGVTRAEFDSSMVYYYTRADRFAPIYNRVAERLQEQATILGDTEGEIGRFASLKADGDTANIWHQNSHIMMIPTPPYHRVDFLVEGDSLFKAGDTFLVQFMADYMYQSGTKDGLLYVAITYPDTVVVRQSRFTYSGLIQLKMDSRIGKCPKSVSGFFYLGGNDDKSTILRLLFVNNIQLIRFHKKDESATINQEDSISASETAQRPFTKTTSSGDQGRSGDKPFPINKRTSPNRVVERIDSIKVRH